MLKKVALIKCIGGYRAFIDLNESKPRNVFIKGEFEQHFLSIANKSLYIVRCFSKLTVTPTPALQPCILL